MDRRSRAVTWSQILKALETADRLHLGQLILPPCTTNDTCLLVAQIFTSVLIHLQGLGSGSMKHKPALQQLLAQRQAQQDRKSSRQLSDQSASVLPDLVSSITGQQETLSGGEM